MSPLLQHDQDNIADLLEHVKQQAIAYLNSLHNAPTTISELPVVDEGVLTEQSIGALGALEKFKQHFSALIVASSGPRFWGFVTGGSTPASIMGDWLTAVFDQNTQGTKGQGNVSAIIEMETIRLLLQLLELPQTFLGGFVTGATLSNFTCLAVARQWAGKELGVDIAKEGMVPGIKVLAATPHSSAIKSLAMLGMGSNNYLAIRVLAGNREAIDLKGLEAQLIQYEKEPCIIISSAGTVNTVDYDDLQAIARLKKKYRFWWHIDAAFGAFAACSPSYKHLLSGWEGADSITIDGHKWLNVPYDSGIFLIRDQYKQLQVETFQNSNAPYLGDPLENFTYLNFLPENSRRLRALPAWFTLTAYGKKGYQEIVENSIALAHKLGKWIEDSEPFELLSPVRLNNVCFTLAAYKEKPDLIKAFLLALNNTGNVFMTPTIYKGSTGIRAAFVNWRTTTADVDHAIEEMKTIYAALTKENQ